MVRAWMVVGGAIELKNFNGGADCGENLRWMAFALGDFTTANLPRVT